MPIHAHLSRSNYYLIVLLSHKLMRLPFMGTIELVDPELRDALAPCPLLPLTAESLMRRRANALEQIGAVPKPNLPDIATDEIHVESAFGAKPIRVLTYRPVTSNDPLPVILHIHGGGFVMGAPEMKDVENSSSRPS
jgi:acetyl esterase/lipase